MSTIAFGPNTFAIMANQRITLRDCVSVTDATHVVKSYSQLDFSGDRHITTDDQGSDIYGLLYRIDRAQTTDAEFWGFRTYEQEGDQSSTPGSMRFADWSEAEWLPLLLLPRETVHQVNAQVNADSELLTLRDAVARVGVGGLLTYTSDIAASLNETEWRVVELIDNGAQMVRSDMGDDAAVPLSFDAATPRWRVVAEGTTVQTAQRINAVTEMRSGAPQWLLPRSAGDAITTATKLRDVGRWLPETNVDTLAARLQDFARWLPGGELESIGHEHANNASLCGVYENTVCPTLGWTPRRGEENSSMRLTTQFFTELDRFERDNQALTPLDRLNAWMRRYDAGNYVNQAIVDSAETNLESHKVDGVNRLLEEVLGWDPIRADREFYVDVRVTRTIEIEVSQTVSVSVTASNEDDASERVDEYLLADYADDYGWEDENGSTHYASTRSGDIDDHEVVDVNEG